MKNSRRALELLWVAVVGLAVSCSPPANEAARKSDAFYAAKNKFVPTHYLSPVNYLAFIDYTPDLVSRNGDEYTVTGWCDMATMAGERVHHRFTSRLRFVQSKHDWEEVDFQRE